MSIDPDQTVVVEEVAELRRHLDVGLVKIDGRLALLAQRSGQADNDLTGLAARVTALEHTRWPLPTVAALSAVGALTVTVWQALGH
ncbi:hypothetical protein [Streptomyces spiramyceticus]|uniref:hypothetical protein n=1 Tax=Streptomyces spiramyceticus TaxID=299717 RepID=UPI00237A9B69|nr:hypothetical protein [Streptomyces spiramyceticus]